jgi:cell division protein FtsW
MNNPVRMKRIMAFLHPEQYRDDVGFQSYQAMLALGSGGTTGLGLGNGRQKLGFVPEQHTDFIFSVIGEELGVVATIGVLLAFVAIFICGLYIAWNARDRFGMILGTGITFLIGLQAFINIGVVTSALPNKGLPLPFISYGPSSLVMMLSGVGILLSIASYSQVNGSEHDVHEPESDSGFVPEQQELLSGST